MALLLAVGVGIAAHYIGLHPAVGACITVLTIALLVSQVTSAAVAVRYTGGMRPAYERELG